MQSLCPIDNVMEMTVTCAVPAHTPNLTQFYVCSTNKCWTQRHINFCEFKTLSLSVLRLAVKRRAQAGEDWRHVIEIEELTEAKAGRVADTSTTASDLVCSCYYSNWYCQSMHDQSSGILGWREETLRQEKTDVTRRYKGNWILEIIRNWFFKIATNNLLMIAWKTKFLIIWLISRLDTGKTENQVCKGHPQQIIDSQMQRGEGRQ